MNEKEIQRALARRYYGRGPFFMNAQFGAFEADFIHVTKTGYVHEVEIKVSRADFKRDFEKTFVITDKRAVNYPEMPVSGDHYWNRSAKKHDAMQHGYERLANRFSFCCPQGLITVDELPRQYGLIYHLDDNQLKVVRSPRVLHRTKLEESRLHRLYVNFWHNRAFKETFRESIAAQKEHAARGREAVRSSHRRVFDAALNTGLTVANCASCAKRSVLSGRNLPGVCWICEMERVEKGSLT